MTSSAPTPSNAFWQRFRDLGSLRRSSGHRAVGGVAEGLSRHFDIDPIIVRVLFAALAFFGGAGIILYLVLWLTVPQDDATHSILSARVHRDPQALITAGLAIGGIAAAVAMLGSLSWAVPHPFPFLLIVAVVALAAVAFTRRKDGHWAYPDDGAAPASDSAPSGTTMNLPATRDEAGTGAAGTTATTYEAPGATAFAPASPPTPAWWQRGDVPPGDPLPPPYAAYPPPPPKRPKSHLFALTMAVIALAIAGLWIVDVTTSLDPEPSVYPGTALGIIAVALLVSTWWGRSRGLIAVGVLASLLTAGAAFAGPGPYGDVVARPSFAGGLHSTYRLGGGRLTLHLEQVSDIANLNGRSTTLNARFGQVVVIIPSSVAATVNATVDHGQIDGVTGQQELDQGGEHVLLAPPADGRPTVEITIHVRFGEILVERAACPGAGLPGIGESNQLWNGDRNVAAACN